MTCCNNNTERTYVLLFSITSQFSSVYCFLWRMREKRNGEIQCFSTLCVIRPLIKCRCACWHTFLDNLYAEQKETWHNWIKTVKIFNAFSYVPKFTKWPAFHNPNGNGWLGILNTLSLSYTVYLRYPDAI